MISEDINRRRRSPRDRTKKQREVQHKSKVFPRLKKVMTTQLYDTRENYLLFSGSAGLIHPGASSFFITRTARKWLPRHSTRPAKGSSPRTSRGRSVIRFVVHGGRGKNAFGPVDNFELAQRNGGNKSNAESTTMNVRQKPVTPC